MKIKAVIKFALPVLVILFCLAGYGLVPNDPFKVSMAVKFQGASMEYPFGTDEMGRCVFSRILYGGRVTIGIVLTGSLVIMVFGTILGLFAGRSSSGRNVLLDSVLNAVTAIPPVAYLIIFIGIWGNSIPTMLVALTASLILRMIKLVKTRTEQELKQAYVMCAVSSGASGIRLLFIHILPNIIREIVHFSCLSCAEMILNISGFSFIGLSLGDDIIDWGSMLSAARNYTVMRPALLIYPVLFIFLAALAFNLLGKQLEEGGCRDAGN